MYGVDYFTAICVERWFKLHIVEKKSEISTILKNSSMVYLFTPLDDMMRANLEVLTYVRHKRLIDV